MSDITQAQPVNLTGTTGMVGINLAALRLTELNLFDEALSAANEIYNGFCNQPRCGDDLSMHLSGMIEKNNDIRQRIIAEMKSRKLTDNEDRVMRIKSLVTWATDCGCEEMFILREIVGAFDGGQGA